jgi:hypothetical protein
MVAVARAENVIVFVPRLAEFDVFPAWASDQAHRITARDAGDAAVQFLEGFHAAIEPGEAVQVTVVDRATGAQTPFVFDLS